MKNYLTAVFAAAIILSACQSNENSNKQYERKVDSLSSVITSKDSAVNDFLSAYDEIEQNLDSVAIKQNVISNDVHNQKGDIKDKRERINSMIVSINQLLEQNRKQIADLNHKLKRNSSKIAQFQKTINNLNEQITQKNAELQSLNDQLAATSAHVAQLQISVDTLSSNNSTQSQEIAAQTATIHTAYYVIGKSKDLAEMKVIDKTGGLLGIGKTSTLNSDMNKSNFKQIDYTQTMTIPINSKKAKIVTSHPSDSYVLDKDTDGKEYTNLRITQPEKFWSESKYLVIVN